MTMRSPATVSQPSLAQAAGLPPTQEAVEAVIRELAASFGNRLVTNPKNRVSAEETWEFCLHGLAG